MSEPGRDIDWFRMGCLPLSRVNMAETLAYVESWAGAGERFRYIVTPNADHVVKLPVDAAFRAAYEAAALSLVDGKPVLWATRYLGWPPFEKVSGSDLAPALVALAARRGWPAAIVGGKSPEELADSVARIVARHPGLRLHGIFAPFGFDSDPTRGTAVLTEIEAIRPRIVLVVCGSPRSENWLHAHAERLPPGVGISVGASYRFMAGLEPRAPRWMQSAGLEWLWRIKQEPRRLWKRYLVDDMKFFPLVWRWKRRGDFTREPYRR